NERKQLQDIEKLIKRPLDVERLVVDSPVRHHHDERGARRGRDERDERGSRRRSGGSFERGSAHAHRQAPIDDFFLKPYEPSPSALSAASAKRDETENVPQKPASKQPLAALLGGFGMPRKTSSS